MTRLNIGSPLGVGVRSGLLMLALLANSALAGRLAQADEVKSRDDGKALAEAKALSEEGSGEYALGHFPEALQAFEKGYRLKHVPGLLFNIAQCYRQMNNFEKAAITYRSFIRTAPKGQQLETARDLLAQVEQTLASERAASTKPPTGQIERDSSAQPPANESAPNANGDAQAQQQAPITAPPDSTQGHENIQAQSTVAVGSTPFYAWIAGGAGVAALASGGVFGLMSKSTASEISSTQHSRPDLTDLQGKFHGQVGTANALFIAGGALLAAGGVLFVLKF